MATSSSQTVLPPWVKPRSVPLSVTCTAPAVMPASSKLRTSTAGLKARCWPSLAVLKLWVVAPAGVAGRRATRARRAEPPTTIFLNMVPSRRAATRGHLDQSPPMVGESTAAAGSGAAGCWSALDGSGPDQVDHALGGLADAVLGHPLGGRVGQGLPQLPVAGHLEAGQPLGDVVAQLLGRGRGA